jgi:FMN-dependent NADH-azoreductase
MVAKVSQQLRHMNDNLDEIERDLIAGIPFIDESWIGANFTADEDRNPMQVDRLQQSNNLVAEIQQADVIVIGSPIYNFSVPAVLKAWVDQIARAGLTFRYTDQGPVGLMTGKQAILVMASGGVPIESELDFATPYLKQVLRFIGVNDVTVIDANQVNEDMLTELLTSFCHPSKHNTVSGHIKNNGAQHV